MIAFGRCQASRSSILVSMSDGVAACPDPSQVPNDWCSSAALDPGPGAPTMAMAPEKPWRGSITLLAFAATRTAVISPRTALDAPKQR